MNSRVEMAAVAVALAEAEEETARGLFAAADADSTTVRGRVDALRSELGAIKARRATGDQRTEDEGQALVLTMDLESLEEVRIAKDAEATTAQAAHRAVSARLGGARTELAGSTACVEVTALQAHALKLAHLLAATLGEHRNAADALLDRADIEEAQIGAIALADAVDPVLLGLMTDIGALGARFGAHRTAWAPTEELSAEVRKADHARTWLPARKP